MATKYIAHVIVQSSQGLVLDAKVPVDAEGNLEKSLRIGDQAIDAFDSLPFGIDSDRGNGRLDLKHGDLSISVDLEPATD